MEENMKYINKKIALYIKECLTWLNVVFIIVVGIAAFTAKPAQSQEVTIVNITDTTPFVSSDPAGLTFLFDSGTLLLSDSEIEETPYYTTGNLFEITPAGDLLASYDTLGFSSEPTGVTFNTVTGTLFFTDDNKRKVFEVDPFTLDNVLSSFSTLDHGSNDPEGITFNPSTGNLFVADGFDQMIFEVTPSGSSISSFPVPSEIKDPEGIYFDIISGNLFMVSDYLFEVTTAGDIVNIIDIQSFGVVKPKGITFAPSSDQSDNPDNFNLFIADYGIDEVNDGKLFEFSLGGTDSSNARPQIDSGPTATPNTIYEDELSQLSVQASDFEGDTLTYTWNTLPGEGTITGSGDTVLYTPPPITGWQTFTITVTVTDVWGGSDMGTVDVTVIPLGTDMSIEARVAASSDDAEEFASGTVALSSSDLEMTLNNGAHQHAGMRFEVEIPRDATITNAYIQFTADETSVMYTSMDIWGEG
jgi:DNA-binding beta-propeller fold protein YncE